jgi:hypothetical protein
LWIRLTQFSITYKTVNCPNQQACRTSPHPLLSPMRPTLEDGFGANFGYFAPNSLRTFVVCMGEARLWDQRRVQGRKAGTQRDGSKGDMISSDLDFFFSV